MGVLSRAIREGRWLASQWIGSKILLEQVFSQGRGQREMGIQKEGINAVKVVWGELQISSFEAVIMPK